ncbi:MAG: histidine kinase [Lachnospiraceae bacterium]|nr:histidine kinase [Lachnospiraceae bacterium]
MKKITQLSFRTQIFLVSLSLVILPSVILGIFAANKSASTMVAEYKSSMHTITSQTSLSLDTLLQDACKIADLPLLSDEVRKTMITDYQDDYLSYAQDSTMFRSMFRHTNRLNNNLETCIFQNRYGFTFEYNINSVAKQNQIYENIEKWESLARQASDSTYFAPLQKDTTSGIEKTIIPMIKILFDRYDFTEIGICYAELNFKSIEKILTSAGNTQNTLFIYNSDHELFYSSAPVYMQEPEKYEKLLSSLHAFVTTLQEDTQVAESELEIGTSRYFINACINPTTQWQIVQFVDNQEITQIYRANYSSYAQIFFLCILLGLILAAVISGILSHSILLLCTQIDSLNPENGGQINIKDCGSNQELQKLILSFNRLNERLTRSLQQNYQIQLNEQKMTIQMLQFQINHHFLYNTLNVIKSLAVLHNVPEIETISLCMSDLLRYNLEHFPVARLEEELLQIKRYLSIQNIRFPNKFKYDCNIPAEFLSMQIPVLILQPLVENSIEHGFSSCEDDCYISISCQLDGKHLHFLVVDNGTGIPADRLEKVNRDCLAGNTSEVLNERGHHSIGLKNVAQRIRSYFGEDCGLVVESMEGKGTIIDIILPVPNKNQEK